MNSPDSSKESTGAVSDSGETEPSTQVPLPETTGKSFGSGFLRLLGLAGTPGSIILISYPKIVFLYPTVIVSLICAFVMSLAGDISAVPVGPVQVSQQQKEGAAPPAAKDAADSDAADSDAADSDAADSDAADSDAADSDAADSDAAVVGEAGLPRAGNSTAEFCGRVFMLTLFLNLVVIGFDFPRTASFTIFFGVVAVLAMVYLLVRMNEAVLPALLTGVLGVKPIANATFYYVFFLGMIAMFAAVVVTRRFDYWEVSGNELLHHQGFLSNLKRYPSPNLRIDKEINDVFEFILLRSGRLILQPSNERTAIVLENVINISRKEERISRMLKQLDVRVW